MYFQYGRIRRYLSVPRTEVVTKSQLTDEGRANNCLLRVGRRGDQETVIA